MQPATTWQLLTEEEYKSIAASLPQDQQDVFRNQFIRLKEALQAKILERKPQGVPGDPLPRAMLGDLQVYELLAALGTFMIEYGVISLEQQP